MGAKFFSSVRRLTPDGYARIRRRPADWSEPSRSAARRWSLTAPDELRFQRIFVPAAWDYIEKHGGEALGEERLSRCLAEGWKTREIGIDRVEVTAP